MSVLEDRYRSLLRLLPASYRGVWEEEMVATFLQSVEADDADYADYLADFGRPSLSEVARVAALAVRLRLAGVGAPPDCFAWGEAVRRVALIGLLAQAMWAPLEVGFSLWSVGKIPWLPAPPADSPFHVPPSMWQVAWGLVGLVWVAAYLALVFGYRRAGQVLAVLAFVPWAADRIIATVGHASRLGAPAFEFALIWSDLLITALPLLALAAFHRDAPPVPRRPWLVALGVGIALHIALAFLMLPPPMHEPALWMMVLDPPGVWSIALVAAAVVHLTRLALGRTALTPTWPLALALLAPAVLAARVLTLLPYAFSSQFVPRSMLPVGILEAVAVLAVGIALAVLAAQALRRLSPAPAEPAASYTPTR